MPQKVYTSCAPPADEMTAITKRKKVNGQVLTLYVKTISTRIVWCFCDTNTPRSVLSIHANWRPPVGTLSTGNIHVVRSEIDDGWLISRYGGAVCLKKRDLCNTGVTRIYSVFPPACVASGSIDALPRTTTESGGCWGMILVFEYS